MDNFARFGITFFISVNFVIIEKETGINNTEGVIVIKGSVLDIWIPLAMIFYEKARWNSSK
jgi:hypothetical protein